MEILSLPMAGKQTHFSFISKTDFLNPYSGQILDREMLLDHREVEKYISTKHIFLHLNTGQKESLVLSALKWNTFVARNSSSDLLQTRVTYFSWKSVNAAASWCLQIFVLIYDMWPVTAENESGWAIHAICTNFKPKEKTDRIVWCK